MAFKPHGVKFLAALLLIAVPLLPAASLPITAAQVELPRTKLRLDTSTGRHDYAVEVAATPEQQERGLMFRTQMAANQGMIFPFAPPRPASFWMENTILPLDLVFIGADFAGAQCRRRRQALFARPDQLGGSGGGSA